MMYADLSGMLDELIAENKAEWIDGVKPEIDKAQEPYQTSTAYDEGVRFGLMLAYQIVDRYKAESEDVVVANKNLCDSCTTKNCIFQSGIVRNHCNFYKAESEDT
jgi:hypothetical protein